ncbi:MAG: carboxypeptidase regulatory-like domain-containing protein, partial [Gemmatimonas sp.]
FAAHAQSVRGVVVDAGERPVPGVVVLLVDSASTVVARALSDERGEFRVAATRAGTYRLRTLRIGFRPVVSAPMAIAAGEQVTRRLVLTGLPIALDTIRVVDRSVCRVFTDSGAATYAVWEQIRTALTAAQLTAASRTIAVTTIARERTVGARPGVNEGTLIQQSAVVQTGYVTQPWRAVASDTLRRFGYVVTAPDNSMIYYAPDLDVLLSGMFVEDHCFRVVRDRRRADQIGIAFEPTPDRRRVPEIRGTLWVDRTSSALRELEFRYANVSPNQEDAAGGDLEFVRMRDGTWAISNWDIRMPILEQVVIPGHASEIRVSRIQTTGGQLVLARRGEDTLWKTRPLVLSGVVIDSASGAGIAGARVRLAGTALEATSDARGRFALSGVIPGRYQVEVHTPSLDSANTSRTVWLSFTDAGARVELRVPNAQQLAAAICGAARGQLAAGTGIVVGRARLRGESSAPRNLSVVAEWSATTRRANDTSSTLTRRLEVHGTADGSFRLCGVPLNTVLTLRATADSAETAEPGSVRIAPSAYLASAELTLDSSAQLESRGAVFTGIVVADSTRAPIAGAEVSLPDLGKSVMTDARGAFRLAGIPAGEQRVVVRRLGYGAADARVAFQNNETVERRVVLGRAVILEPVTVSASPFERAMASFDDNKRVGLGHFMTRADIAKYDGMKLSGVLAQIPGVELVEGRGAGAWVTSRRAPRPLCPPGQVGTPDAPTVAGRCLMSHGYYIPYRDEADRGVKIACYAQVWLDGALVNGIKEPTEPFDINEIAPERIEAMEFYTGSAETPLKYSRMGSACGVLVLWTRR